MWVLVALVGLVLSASLAAAFWAGRSSVARRDSQLVASAELGETLLGALREKERTPEEVAGVLRVYDREPGEEAFLATISWVPPAVPAPFVGHVARPGTSANARINAFGFRDDRAEYRPDPAVYRVFVTGGSTAFGTGAPRQEETVPAFLERRLREEAPAGRQVEVVNAAYPAWSTTQERLLITQRLVALGPGRILMLSGGNDVHWALRRRDVTWFWSYADEQFVTFLDAGYRRAGRPSVRVAPAEFAEVPPCERVAAVAALNARLAADAASGAGADLVFALQPNIFSTTKRLTPREATIRERVGAERAYWDACYAELRRQLAALEAERYRFIDLSGLFGDVSGDEDLFLDSYHFGAAGNEALARALAESLEWP